MLAPRPGDAPGAVRGEHRLERMAGGRADERAALPGEELVELLGVVPLQRGAGEDDGAGVDILPGQSRVGVPARDRRSEGGRVDGVVRGVRRQDDRRAVEHLALHDDVPARERVGEPLQAEPGEHRVARRGSDVDADRAQHHVVRLAGFDLARERRGIDELVVVTLQLRQAGSKTSSIRDGMPRFRSSSS